MEHNDIVRAFKRAYGVASWAGHHWSQLSWDQVVRALRGIESLHDAATRISVATRSHCERGACGWGITSPIVLDQQVLVEVGAGLRVYCAADEARAEYAARGDARWICVTAHGAVLYRDPAPRDLARCLAALEAAGYDPLALLKTLEQSKRGDYISALANSEEFASYWQCRHNAGHCLASPATPEPEDGGEGGISAVPDLDRLLL